ncbi:MAG: asparagine synthase (glutamine-hydrolyzing) [Paracoccaceae bacterium]|jgi:asparagine synthase (glutamine-hydrolysing)
MSGIAAILNTQSSANNEQLIVDMAAMMARRGPAYQQYWCNDNIAMAHTLLPTTLRSVDENQPSTINGDIWLTSDVRIDARDELIRKIKAYEPTIESNLTDDQLLLHAYRVWGVDCLEHIIGDFAFILWDSPNRRLFCATDHFGVAPLYYATTSQGLCISNTLNAIRLHPEVSNQLDELAVADYLLFRINENNNGTMFEDIKHLPAGHCLIHEHNDTRLKKYWSSGPTEEFHHTTPASYLEEFGDLLKTAVEDRISTQSIGVHLSGGMDSSSVTAMANMSGRAQQTPTKITAYTYGASGELTDLESPFACEIANQMGIEHHIIPSLDESLDHPATPQDLRSPEPRFTSRETTTYKLLEHVATHSSVLLSGFGGDPLLRGRSLNRGDFSSPSKLFSMLKHFQQHRKLFGVRPSLGLRPKQSNDIEQREIPAWINPDFSEKHQLLERFHSILATKTAPNSAQISMTNGGLWRRIFCWNDPGFTHIPVKVLHPFFDTRLLAYAQNLPPFPWLQDKTILRQAMRPYLPISVIERPKTPLPGNGLQSVLSRKTPPNRFHKLLNNPQLGNYLNITPLKSVLTDPNNSNKADFKAIIRAITLSDWLAGYEKAPITPILKRDQKNVRRIKFRS